MLRTIVVLVILDIRNIDRVELNRIREYVNSIKEANTIIQKKGLISENVKA